MASLLAPEALLATGWARDVLLEWDPQGTLTRVEPRQPASAAPHASGPVLPGMANVHSHAFQRAMAGLAERRGHPTDDFWTWREAMYDLVARLEPEDVQAIAEFLYVEMLKHGYTAVAEFHYLHRDRRGKPYADAATLPDRIVAAARSSGIALTLLPVLYHYGGFGGYALKGGQLRFASDAAGIGALVTELARRHEGLAHLRLGVAPHSVRAIDAMQLTDLVGIAARIDESMPIHMHLSEQAREVAECKATHGVTPFEWVSGIVDVDRFWCFIHATHLTPREVEGAAKCDAVLGLCPTTEANLGDGIFDFPAWFSRAADWGIGGDSHVSVSPFEELRALEESQRLRLRVRNVASSEGDPDVASNLWRGAAEGGARAIGQPMGTLAPGRRADFVVLDAGDPDFEGLGDDDRLAVAMFAGTSNRVRDVFVAGRRVVEDGHHAREDEATDGYRSALRRLRARN
jgi:formimidoylglutamate deiminase